MAVNRHYLLLVSVLRYLTLLSILVVQEQGLCSVYPPIEAGFDVPFWYVWVLRIAQQMTYDQVVQAQGAQAVFRVG